MKLELISSEKNVLEFRLIGERHTLPQLLKNKLLSNPEVVFVSYKLEHPMDSDSLFIIRTKKADPKKVLLKASKSIIKDLDDFGLQIKSLK